MLVLTRKKDDETQVSIGGQVMTLKILKVERGKVLIGFDAPKEIRIIRKEAKKIK